MCALAAVAPISTIDAQSGRPGVPFSAMKTHRPIAPDEAAVVQWLLARPAPGEPQIEPDQAVLDLIVVATCPCGCRSVEFAADNGSPRVVRDACFQRSDGLRGGVLLSAAGNTISGLEFYDLDPGASHRCPSVFELRTWEQLGEGLAR
jgi:hypothetical protein